MCCGGCPSQVEAFPAALCSSPTGVMIQLAILEHLPPYLVSNIQALRKCPLCLLFNSFLKLTQNGSFKDRHQGAFFFVKAISGASQSVSSMWRDEYFLPLRISVAVLKIYSLPTFFPLSFWKQLLVHCIHFVCVCMGVCHCLHVEVIELAESSFFLIPCRSWGSNSGQAQWQNTLPTKPFLHPGNDFF